MLKKEEYRSYYLDVFAPSSSNNDCKEPDRHKILIFSKDGKDIKRGIRIGEHWKAPSIFHYEKRIGNMLFGSVDELEEGWSSREEIMSEDEFNKFLTLTKEEEAEEQEREKQQVLLKKLKEEMDYLLLAVNDIHTCGYHLKHKIAPEELSKKLIGKYPEAEKAIDILRKHLLKIGEMFRNES